MNITAYCENRLIKLKQIFTGKTEAAQDAVVVRNRLRMIMDDLKFANRLIREDNVLLGALDADENFQYDVTAIITSEDQCVQIHCIAGDFRIPEIRLTEALLFCNKWNNEKVYPAVCIDPHRNTFIAKYNAPLDHNNSREFFQDQVLGNGLGSCWHFFIEAGKTFITQPNHI